MSSTDRTGSLNEQDVVASVPTQLFVGGQWRDAAGGKTLPVEDPATGDILCQVADAGPDDAMAALDSAVEAMPGWSQTPPRERGEILRRAFEAVIDRTEELALLMTLEMGKPVAQSRSEVVYAAEFLRWFSEEASRIEGGYRVSPDGTGRILTMRQPVGPCLFITPWNFPLAMGTRKIGPAIAAGCTMVAKPAAQTPLSMLALAQILADAGLPDGVLNIYTTSDSAGTTSPVIADHRLRKLSFTGSTPVGRTLGAQAADNVLRVSMELGGNAPFLVFADADVEAAVDGAMIAKMRNMGEACTAANRFLVHRDVADAFTKALAERISSMKVGRGTEEGVDLGPLIDEDGRQKVSELVTDAVQTGADPIVGGGPVDGPGYFYEPTVLADVPLDARILHEEAFGPVAPITTFATDDEAVAAANNTDFGLVAYAYTRDIQSALRIVERLEVGMVGLNAGKVSNASAPFGGVKHSGVGREGGPLGIDEFLETKYVAVPL